VALSRYISSGVNTEAMSKIMEMIDMPDRLAQNLILCVHQNDGKLSKRKREQKFSALTVEMFKG